MRRRTLIAILSSCATVAVALVVILAVTLTVDPENKVSTNESFDIQSVNVANISSWEEFDETLERLSLGVPNYEKRFVEQVDNSDKLCKRSVLNVVEVLTDVCSKLCLRIKTCSRCLKCTNCQDAQSKCLNKVLSTLKATELNSCASKCSTSTCKSEGCLENCCNSSNEPVESPVTAPLSIPIEPATEPSSSPPNEPVTRSIEPLSEPVTGPISVPATVPISTPVTGPVNAPVQEPISTPVTVPVNEPMTVPVNEPTTVPVTAPVQEPTSTPVTVPITAPVQAPIDTCLLQTDCPLNYVCDGTPRRCIGIEGAICNSTVTCYPSYICASGICVYNSSNALSLASRVNTCSQAPIMACNTTTTITLRESNVLASSLGCSLPTSSYSIGTPVAFFRMPTTNASFDSLDLQFRIVSNSASSPISIRTMLECGSLQCGRELNSTHVNGSFLLNHYIDTNAVGVSRGYIILANSPQFPPEGHTVQVSTSCYGNLPQTCTVQSDCPINTVCDRSLCMGLQGATCDAIRVCAGGYNCVSGRCLNNAVNAFNAATEVSRCSGAPVLGCNTTANIAFRESNTILGSVTCSNPSVTYPAGTSVAYFYMPPTNGSWDKLDVTFRMMINDPALIRIHVLTPCGSNSCDRRIEPTQVYPGFWQWRHTFDYNTVGVVRGYALFTNAQLPAPNGLRITVNAGCVRQLDEVDIPNSNACPNEDNMCKGDEECYKDRVPQGTPDSPWECRVPSGKRCRIGGTRCEGSGLTCRLDSGTYKCLPTSIQATSCIPDAPIGSSLRCSGANKVCSSAPDFSGLFCYSSEYGPCDDNSDCVTGNNLSCYLGTCTKIDQIPPCPSVTRMRAIYADLRECYRDYTDHTLNTDFNPLCYSIGLRIDQCCRSYPNTICTPYYIRAGTSPRPGYNLAQALVEETDLSHQNTGRTNFVCSIYDAVNIICGYDFSVRNWGLNGDNYPYDGEEIVPCPLGQYRSTNPVGCVKYDWL